MRQIRTSFVVLVAIAVLAVAVPAAQARSIDRPQPAVHTQDGAWLAYSLDNALDHAMTWLARLAGNEPPAVSRTMMKTTTLPPPPTGHNAPQGLNCIDPMGIGRCDM